MTEIKCPKCGEVFQVDEAGYAAIVKQVRDKEFSKELKERENHFADEKETAIRLAKLQTADALKQEIATLEKELADKEHEKEAALQKIVSEKDLKIASLDKQLTQLDEQLKRHEAEIQLAVQQTLTEKKDEIEQRDREIIELNHKIDSQEKENQLKEQTLKEKWEAELKSKDELISYYKDMKAKQSTKMLGESLEQHCEIQFNQLRATGFQNAYFEKDNDIRTGSKGDYIFRQQDEDGTEFISIMFEMKNEADATATKKKNEDFLKELDKDRREKNCEYAVLVSLLEPENELYNNGIVDMSYRYPKMYVVRPQFFIPIITLLRNAAENALQVRKELAVMRSQEVDLTNFEAEMNDFKSRFSRNYDLASRRFQEAIAEIDKTIDHLNKTKEALLSSENNLRLANNKAEELSIKRLTRNSPMLAEKFRNIAESETIPQHNA